MRVRTTTTGALNDITYGWRVYNEAGVQTGTIWTYGGKRKIKTISDVDTPFFTTLLKCGKFLPLNKVDITTEEVEILAGSGTETLFADGTPYYAGDYALSSFPPNLALPPVNDSLADAAVLSAAANAASSQFDVATFLGEFRDTMATMENLAQRIARVLNLLARRARRLAKTVRNLRKRRKPYRKLVKHKGDPGNAWDQFADLWLLGRYGIRPLVYDFYNAQKAMEALQNGSTLIRGSGKQTETFSDTYNPGYVDAGLYRYRWSESLTMERIYRGRAYVQFKDVKSVAFGYDPFVTAWELTRFSFILDWMIDIGSWVQTLTPRMNGDYLGLCLSVRTTYTHIIAYEELMDPPGSGGLSPSTWTKVVNSYTREPTSIPFPPLLPRLSIPKVVDLLTIFFRGKKGMARTLNRR